MDGDARWTTTSNMVRDAAENDYILAKDYAVHCGLATEHDFDDRFESRFWQIRDTQARQFVEDYWDKIKRVADQLDCSVELTDEQVRVLVRMSGAGAFVTKWLRHVFRATT